MPARACVQLFGCCSQNDRSAKEVLPLGGLKRNPIQWFALSFAAQFRSKPKSPEMRCGCGFERVFLTKERWSRKWCSQDLFSRHVSRVSKRCFGKVLIKCEFCMLFWIKPERYMREGFLNTGVMFSLEWGHVECGKNYVAVVSQDICSLVSSWDWRVSWSGRFPPSTGWLNYSFDVW